MAGDKPIYLTEGPVGASWTIPKTGQTTSYATGDDGYWQRGRAWPTPRFSVQSNLQCVVDNYTGLTWAREADWNGGMGTWTSHMTFCNNLTYGGYSDWRMPNIRELESLIYRGAKDPALTPGHPFGKVITNGNIPSTIDWYWSSTTFPGVISYAFVMQMYDGLQYTGQKSLAVGRVWPVRGGV